MVTWPSMLLCLLAVSSASATREQHHAYLLQAQANPFIHFNQWVEQHGKSYVKDALEFKRRFAAWLDNLHFVVEYNKQHASHWLGMNHLADLTHDEFKANYLGFNASLRGSALLRSTPGQFRYANVNEADLPKEVDWRKRGAVSEVKNQMQCGSCWAFSTTGAIEGINAIVTKDLLSLSEQELVDCDTSRDMGCGGGLMDFAFQFVIDNGGLDTEEDYPYMGEQGTCEEGKRNRKVVTIDGFEDVPAYDESAIKKAAAHQPVSVAVEADQRAFQLYAGGVFDDDSCGSQLDHGVLIVGYGEDPAHGSYWIVKNSWGPAWGEKGFIRLARNKNAPEGQCGIAMKPSYPVKTGPNPPKPPPGPAPGPAPGPEPGPQPVECDAATECPPATTCCCLSELFGMCFSWGCCPMPSAVCCADHQHCCPPTLPVCDTDVGRCLAKPGVFAGSEPWAEKLPATRHFPRWGAHGRVAVV